MAIKQMRKTAGYSAKGIAARLGMNYRRYLCLENGEVKPTTEELIAIADFFKVTVDELIRGVA